MVSAVDRVEALSCQSIYEATWLERNLLGASLPPWNRTPGGQETAVWIRIDDDAQTPGLRVRHEPCAGAGARCYGPYLGGDQVRRAVSGLNRVLPVSLTGTGAAGGQRDLARCRGVTVGDRAGIVRELSRVLGRSWPAVAAARRGLERMRAAAAAHLAFELPRSSARSRRWIGSPAPSR